MGISVEGQGLPLGRACRRAAAASIPPCLACRPAVLSGSPAPVPHLRQRHVGAGPGVHKQAVGLGLWRIQHRQRIVLLILAVLPGVAGKACAARAEGRAVTECTGQAPLPAGAARRGAACPAAPRHAQPGPPTAGPPAHPSTPAHPTSSPWQSPPSISASYAALTAAASSVVSSPDWLTSGCKRRMRSMYAARMARRDAPRGTCGPTCGGAGRASQVAGQAAGRGLRLASCMRRVCKTVRADTCCKASGSRGRSREQRMHAHAPAARHGDRQPRRAARPPPLPIAAAAAAALPHVAAAWVPAAAAAAGGRGLLGPAALRSGRQPPFTCPSATASGIPPVPPAAQASPAARSAGCCGGRPTS